MSLQAQRVLVTGAARRVGRAIAELLAAEGARVVVHCNRSTAEAAALAAAIGGKVVQGDLARLADVERVCDEAVAAFGGIDALVNNASVYGPTPLEAVDEETWDAVLGINLKAPFFLARRLGLAMRAAGGGQIVNLADWAAFRPYPDYIPYCISKAGLVALTRGLARELAPQVRVNAVAPGPVLLPDRMGEQEATAVAVATPLQRIGAPRDVALAVRYLLADAPFVTGVVLPVDGGRLLG